MNLTDETDNHGVEDMCLIIKNTYHDAAKASFGYKKIKKEEYISDETQKFIERHKETKRDILNAPRPGDKYCLQLRYKGEDKNVKKKIISPQKNSTTLVEILRIPPMWLLHLYSLKGKKKANLIDQQCFLHNCK